TLEVMHQPLEDGVVTISRADGSLNFPAKFLLVCALNPCACGYYGDSKRECRCSPRQVESYRQRISGPLLDRIDLHVEVPLVEYRDLASDESGGISSATIRERVSAARSVQRHRLRGKGTATNASMSPRQVREHCKLDRTGAGYLEHAMEQMNFSARAHDR